MPAPTRAPAEETERAVGTVGFAKPATSQAGLSFIVLRPEKIKGGVRFTVALANTTGAPITVNTADLGPHGPRFNGAVVPMTMASATKKLVPGEGYTYQCVIRLPTMDVGRMEFVLGPVTVTGMAAGD